MKNILDNLGFYSGLFNVALIFLIGLPLIFRNVREWRLLHNIRVQMVAFVKQLQEQGVNVEARCIYCVSLLPKHVDDCPMRDPYERFHFVMECMTRPAIKYLPKK